jgi:hypothetical protein
MSCCTPKMPQGVCCDPKPELAADAPCCGAEAVGNDRITRGRELPDPDHLRGLDPRYAIERPALARAAQSSAAYPAALWFAAKRVLFAGGNGGSGAAAPMRFTVLTPHVAQLTDRYSERKEDTAKLDARTKISAT